MTTGAKIGTGASAPFVLSESSDELLATGAASHWLAENAPIRTVEQWEKWLRHSGGARKTRLLHYRVRYHRIGSRYFFDAAELACVRDVELARRGRAVMTAHAAKWLEERRAER